MKKNVIYTATIVFILFLALCVGLYLNSKKQDNTDWEMISIGTLHSINETIEIDLDGNGTKEIIGIKQFGDKLSINNTNYTVNKNFDINNPNEYKNEYYFVDLNSDGLVEIIHFTQTTMISPSISYYTIYNFEKSNIKEVESFSIHGRIPNEVYVKGNTVKFDYWPSESPENYTEEVTFTLNRYNGQKRPL